MEMPGIQAVRLERLRRGLDLAQNALPTVGTLDPALGGRLIERFERIANDIRRDLADPKQAAAAMLQAEELITEVLGYLAGAAASKAGLAGMVHSLALAWLDQLSKRADLPRVGLVIASSTEFFGTAANVIRLRLPDDGLWGLPVAVHEYGHFVATQLGRRTVDIDGIPQWTSSVEGLLADAAKQSDMPNLFRRGHEIFADIVATLISGPAYAYYCLSYRFDPAEADMTTDSHPSPSRRVASIVSALEQVAPEDRTGYLASAAVAVRREWESSCASTRTSPDPPADGLDEITGELLAVATKSGHLRNVSYVKHGTAHVLADELGVPDRSITGSRAVLVNAAWERRRKLRTVGLSEMKLRKELERIESRAMLAFGSADE